jgi:hypothetical protein
MNEIKIAGFYAQEFVPPEIFKDFGPNNSWWFVQPNVVKVCEALRKYFDKPLIVNNWNVGGKFRYRGYRPRKYAQGGENSQHRLGNAADLNIEGIDSNEVRKHILAYKDMYMLKGLTTIEHADFAPTWVHFDCRPTGMKEILIVKPL